MINILGFLATLHVSQRRTKKSGHQQFNKLSLHDLHHWKHSVKFVIPFTSEKQYSSDTHLVDYQYQPDKTNHSSSKTSLIKVGKKQPKADYYFKSDTCTWHAIK